MLSGTALYQNHATCRLKRLKPPADTVSPSEYTTDKFPSVHQPDSFHFSCARAIELHAHWEISQFDWGLQSTYGRFHQGLTIQCPALFAISHQPPRSGDRNLHAEGDLRCLKSLPKCLTETMGCPIWLRETRVAPCPLRDKRKQQSPPSYAVYDK